jgi:alkylhydroperoxidase/carboxymuconolactone decarboxylase family protein YurZ
MQNINPYMMFRQEAPQAAAAFDGLIGAVCALGGLDDKTRQLIYIGIKASQGDSGAVAAHAPMAKQAGATREEVRDAVLLTLTTSGISGVIKCLPSAMEAYDNPEGRDS